MPSRPGIVDRNPEISHTELNLQKEQRMRRILVALVILLTGCSQTSGPIAVIGTPNTTAPSGPGILISPYGEQLDTLYVKVWSDSSWAKFGGWVTIGTTKYFVLASSSGDDYYYGPAGYSGFFPSGGSLILFDTPIGPWPDTLQIGGSIQQSTTFTYQGTAYAMSIVNTLLDTESVSAPFGVFDPSLHFEIVYYQTVAGLTNYSISESWDAKGPGEIAEANSLGQSIFMVRGYVNGKTWGASVSKASVAPVTRKPYDLPSRVMYGAVHSPLR